MKYRVVVPDLIGFGKSDKPARQTDHSLARHVHWLSEFITKLDLSSIVLVGHGFGGMAGLRCLAENPYKFSRVVLTNTGLPVGEGSMVDGGWLRPTEKVPTKK